MITITKNKNKIVFKGHASSAVCAGVSSIMYTTVNAISKYKSEAIDYKDVNDIVTIKIIKTDIIIDLLINNMFDMFNDLVSQVQDGEVKIIKK